MNSRKVEYWVRDYVELTNSYNEQDYVNEYEDYISVNNIISLVIKIIGKRIPPMLRHFIETTNDFVPAGFTRLGLFVIAGICKLNDEQWWSRLCHIEHDILNTSSKFIIYDRNEFRHKVYSGTPVVIAIQLGYFDVLIDLIEAGAERSDVYNEFYENISEEFNIKHSKMFDFFARCTCQSYRALRKMTPIEKCLFLSIKISLNEFTALIMHSSLVKEISNDCWRVIFLDMLVQDNLEYFIYLISIGFDLNIFGDKILYGMINGFTISRDYYLLEYSSTLDRARYISNCYENIKKNFNKIVELIFFSSNDYTYEELLELTDNSYENGLMELKLMPISLQNICRKIIRQCIKIYGHNMKNAINCLSIMPGIKPFLHMKDLICHIV